jgi:hypothetical protein
LARAHPIAVLLERLPHTGLSQSQEPMTGVVVLSTHYIQASRLNALDNSYPAAPEMLWAVPFMDIAWFGVIILMAMIWIVLDV